MANGLSWAERHLTMDYHQAIGWGMLTAAATGLGAWVAGYPFLTSTVWHVDVPGLGDIHIASAMFFDAGVFLVVVGATLLGLVSLARTGAGTRPLAKPPASGREEA
jgi:multicomponent K+:H+ antiporter subunit A